MKYIENYLIGSSFFTRCNESEKIARKYPGKIPIIIDGASPSSPEIIAHKYLVPYEMSVGNFMHLIRTRVHMKPTEALFLFVINVDANDSSIREVIPSVSQLMSEVYKAHKSSDGFLYIKYEIENTFG
jgi:GABA(A) receptor-associated protein